MFLSWPILVLLGVGVFLAGSVVGSFLNVCIYRIPWEKSVVWPSSRCPRCWETIAARDNVPILGWIALRGECRSCGASISIRYPLVELLVGLLFLAAYVVDVIGAPRGSWGQIPLSSLGMMAYHTLLIALLVAASFIDFDLFIIPDAITIPGMALGLAIGTMSPTIRPEPGTATSYLEGFGVGLLGLVVGGGLTELVRRTAGGVASLLVSLREGRRVEVEAMGFGDVTLMAMIGSFLGWQAAILTFFIGPFFGLVPACWKFGVKIWKRLTDQRITSLDRELPFGPYLSLGAVTLTLSWNWFWPAWGRGAFATFRWLFWHLLGVQVAIDP